MLGPRHVLPLIGDPLCVIGQDVTAGYERMHQKYGKIVGFNFSGKLFVSISDLDIIQKVTDTALEEIFWHDCTFGNVFRIVLKTKLNISN